MSWLVGASTPHPASTVTHPKPRIIGTVRAGAPTPLTPHTAAGCGRGGEVLSQLPPVVILMCVGVRVGGRGGWFARALSGSMRAGGHRTGNMQGVCV